MQPSRIACAALTPSMMHPVHRIGLSQIKMGSRSSPFLFTRIHHVQAETA